MFWNSAATSSNLDTILEQPDITLQKVLEQEDVLSELRAMNKKLTEFLTRPDNIRGMIDLITSEPPDDLPLAAQYKLANISCEVLTCDNTFAEKLTADPSFLDKLFIFFRDKPAPINPLLASYVCRVLSELVIRKADQNWYSYQLSLIQMMQYFTEVNKDSISWLLHHLDCSAVCEFFYKLIMNVEGQEQRNSLYCWMVNDQAVIKRIIEKMTRNESGDVHSNISRLVGDLLFAFQDEMILSNQERSTDCDPFLQALRSHDTITTLLAVLFSQDAICETSVMHGLDLLLSLLGVIRRSPRQPGRNDSLDEDNDGIFFTDSIKQELLSLMPTLLKLLESPVDPYSIPLSYGILEKPVGLGRLAIAKFIAHLFTLNDDTLNMGMIESGILKQLLDLFWENPWNNFLHRYVCKILSSIAKSASNSPGSASYLVMEVGILSKILEVFENKGLKVGYRGHLAMVASIWGECASVDGSIKDLMKKLEESDEELYSKWDAFYSDTLESYLSEEKVLLAGVHPPASGLSANATMGGGSLSSSNATMPYDSDSSGVMWDGTSAISFSSATASTLLSHMDFDNISSFSSVMDGLSDENKARSMFEMFCTDKTNTLDDDDEDEEGIDSPTRRRRRSKDDIFDLGSPDEDSLDDERLGHWEDNDEDKINMNISNDEDDEDPFGRKKGDGIDNGNDDDDDSPSAPPVTILGSDPWSGFDSVKTGAAGDPWSNTKSLGGIGGSVTMPIPVSSEGPPGLNSCNSDWAQFDFDGQAKLNQEEGATGVDDEWASFESAVAIPDLASVIAAVENLNLNSSSFNNPEPSVGVGGSGVDLDLQQEHKPQNNINDNVVVVESANAASSSVNLPSNNDIEEQVKNISPTTEEQLKG